MLVIEIFKHLSNDLNLVRLLLVSKSIGLCVTFLSDLDLPNPAFQALLIPVVEIERSSELLSFLSLFSWLAWMIPLPAWRTPQWHESLACRRVGFLCHFSYAPPCVLCVLLEGAALIGVVRAIFSV